MQTQRESDQHREQEAELFWESAGESGETDASVTQET